VVVVVVGYRTDAGCSIPSLRINVCVRPPFLFLDVIFQAFASDKEVGGGGCCSDEAPVVPPAACSGASPWTPIPRLAQMIQKNKGNVTEYNLTRPVVEETFIFLFFE
jgi:hypothetical protein